MRCGSSSDVDIVNFAAGDIELLEHSIPRAAEGGMRCELRIDVMETYAPEQRCQTKPAARCQT
jgi:hypothetical protein